MRAEGDLLIVRERARIPKICVKCGATRDVVRRHQQFAMGHHGAGAGAAGGVVGAALASSMRGTFRDDPAMMAAVLVGIVGVVSVGAWIAHGATSKLQLDVPLCRTHDAAIDAALQHRTWLLLGLALAGLLGAFGVAVSSVALGITAVAIFALVLVLAYGLGMPKAWIPTRWARGGEVAIAVGPELAQKLVARAEKRAKKNDGAGDDEPDVDATAA
ncbi:MAG: hypothetical protein M3Y87_36155 [Myxococcota bacterium]|nr:hypothetical protein [Myxococcota bacterium]